jgi:mannose-6-phosphate isomerase-like protein (cupin superfamily)
MMNRKCIQRFAAFAALALVFIAGMLFADQPAKPLVSDIISGEKAQKAEFDWGSFYTYYQGETYGTKDILTGVAVIKPGWEIHPPHVHVEEEYLVVTEGEGTWHLNGKSFPAQKGDILYAAPWDIHGIKNTGETPLTFVVWKWNNKGVELPAQPEGVNGGGQ